MNTLIWQILLQIILIIANAIFACAEIAVISMNDTKLERLAAEKNKKAIRLLNLTEQPSRFLSTIQVAITLSGFLGSAFAADNFSEYLVNGLSALGLNNYISLSVLDTISVIVITIILSYITLIFGELVPKRIAMKKCEQISLALSGILTFVSKAFSPLVNLLTFSTNATLTLLGIDPNEEDETITEEEIRMMIDAGSEKGTIDNDEKEFIQNIFEFDDTEIEKICTHRKEIEYLWLTDDIEKWDLTIKASKHTKFPICNESKDNLIGILDANSYLRMDIKDKETVLKSCVSEPQFVLETIKADVMFEKMKISGNHFAVVLDEYGGLTGIITMTDLIQEIFGHFSFDGENSQEQEIEKISDNKWRINGETSLKDVCDSLKISLPENDYDTLSGYIFGLLGYIPDDGTNLSLSTDVINIEVENIKNHCVENALISLIENQ